MAKTKAAPPASEPVSETDPANPHDIQPTEQPVSLDEVRVDTPEPTEETTAPTRRKSRHEEQMDAIVAARHVELDRENAYARSMGMGEAPAPVEAQETPEAPPAPVAEPEPSAPPPAPDAPAAPIEGRVHKLTVNGREIEIPEADVFHARVAGEDLRRRRDHRHHRRHRAGLLQRR